VFDGKKDVKPGGGGDDPLKGDKKGNKTVVKQTATVEKGKVTSGNMSNDDIVD
jgi:hypothetical protein